jgi:anaerobic selenocysteine-containing dehydrogenase
LDEGFISTDDEGKVAPFDGLFCKSYNPWDSNVTFRGEAGRGLFIHPYWTFAWLFNRRVMYNQGTTTARATQPTLFVAPDQVSRFFVHHTSDPIGDTGQGRTGGVTNYTWFYRAYSRFADPDFRTPRHVEAWESPLTEVQRAAIEAQIGTPIGPIGISPPEAYANTDALRAQYPLVFTTFRYVMHYQGGAMTRNLPNINTIRPRPFLELHPDDAAARGIVNGEDVYVQSMRGKNVGPYVALVADNIQKGVTGAPWHWGDTGLNTGPAPTTRASMRIGCDRRRCRRRKPACAMSQKRTV